MLHLVSLSQFAALTRDMEWVAPTQTAAWTNAFLPQGEARYVVDDLNKPTMACVGQLHRKWGVSMLLVAGECLAHTHDLSSEQVHRFYEDLLQLVPADLYYVNSDSLYSPLYEVGMRQAGFLRPVGMFSTTLSKLIATDQELTPDKSWRRNLKKAEEHRLTFSVVSQPSAHDVEQYLQLHHGVEQRKHFSDSATANQLTCLLADPMYRLAWVDSAEGEHLSGGVFYCRHQGSPYARFIYSATSLKGREVGSAYWLRKQVTDYLATVGIPVLDTGRITPAKHAKNGLFLFKNGMGGETVSYNGEWLWTRRPWLAPAFYLANRFIFKRVRV